MELLKRNPRKNSLPSERLIYIGLRDIDPYEAYIIHKLNISTYAMDEIDRYGIGKIMEIVLDKIPCNSKIHVSFDIDALDAKVAPSTGTPVIGGLTLREAVYIMEMISATNNLEGMDIVEFHPQLGTTTDLQTTINAIMQIVKSAFANYKRRGDFQNIDFTRLQLE